MPSRSKSLCRRVVAGAIALCAWATCAAGVDERLNIVEYDVQINGGLLQSLDAASPIRFEGRSFHAYTQWSVAWSYRWWRESDGRCRITEAPVKLEVTMQLPALRRAPPVIAKRFDAYLSALRTHENGHHQFGKMAALEIQEKILALPQMNDCASLEKTADSTTRRILEKYRHMERRYDMTTAYGESQGAKLTE